MRIKVIVCETLFREIYLAAAQAPNRCDLKFLPRECHDDLEMMRRMLEEELAATNDGCHRVERGVRCPACDANRHHDAVVLAMGLCGNTVLGLRAPDVPLVLPKVHDCSGLLLGGNDRYLAEEQRTVFYHQGAVETLGAGLVDAVPKKYGLGRSLKEYIEKYGEDNGRYIHEMEHGFAAYNERALVLSHAETDKAGSIQSEVEDYMKTAGFNWHVETKPIIMTMFHRLLAGEWDEKDFLVVPPGDVVRPVVERGGAFA